MLDHDACDKLERWFNDRWDDRWSIDISDELVQVIEESWARETTIQPYHVYADTLADRETVERFYDTALHRRVPGA